MVEERGEGEAAVLGPEERRGEADAFAALGERSRRRGEKRNRERVEELLEERDVRGGIHMRLIGG